MRSFLEEVDFGIKGGNKGIPGGLPRFDKFTNNIQKSTFYVIGAQQKTGKSAFVDFRFVLQPYLSGHKNVHWIYFSYEIDKTEKMAKFCAFFMWHKYKILCDSNYILSRGENKLSSEHRVLVDKIYNEDIKPLFERIDFIEDKSNPTGIYNYLLEYAKKNGEFIYEDYFIQEEGQTVSKKRIVGYKENNSDLVTIIILDHVGLMRRERGYTKKDNIDKISEYFVWLRNRCKFTPIAISQFNRDLSKVDRLKFSGEDLQPTVEDFKDTGNLSEDASMVIALFNPTLYPHIKRHLGYDLTRIGKSYRSAHILASRNTETGINLSLFMVGENGFFYEIPKVEEMTDEVYNKLKKWR
jgi:hypothetical protein